MYESLSFFENTYSNDSAMIDNKFGVGSILIVDFGHSKERMRAYEFIKLIGIDLAVPSIAFELAIGMKDILPSEHFDIEWKKFTVTEIGNYKSWNEAVHQIFDFYFL